MTGLSALRSRMRKRGRTVLGVFLIAWLNATLQPCLMAMEAPANAMAPTSMSPDHTNHGDHVASGTDHVCPHCPPSVSHDSNSCSVAGLSDCDTLPAAKQGERILKIDPSDAFDDVQISYHYFGLDQALTFHAPIRARSVRPTFVVGPPQSIQNCVFLK